MSDFGEGKDVKTRKRHRCAWCGQTIPKGTIGYHYGGMFDGEWQNWYMHLECKGSYALDDDGDGFAPYENERAIP